MLTGKIRYNHPGAPCTLKKLEDGRVQVNFLEPQRAVTPGQAVVLYRGEYVAGGRHHPRPSKRKGERRRLIRVLKIRAFVL